MDGEEGSVGTIALAVRHAEHLLTRDPHLAMRQASAILEASPGHPQAELVLGAAHLRLGELDAAHAILGPLAASQPRAAAVQLEWGLLLASGADIDGAIEALARAVALRPDLPHAWRSLGDLLTMQARGEEADRAYAQHLRSSVQDGELIAAADALCANDLPQAERRLRERLKRTPTDVAAIRMLAEAGIRLGRYVAAEQLLLRCLELAPGFAGARHNYALVLYRQNRAAEAVPHMERLVAEAPRDPAYRNLLAAILASVGSYDRAIGLYADLVERQPRQPRLWLGYGHALRTAGRHQEAVAAYRACLDLPPPMGEAWWSLANLKTGVLDASDQARMQALLQQDEALAAEDRYHLDYALGRAHEDAGEYASSWACYARGAALRRAEVSYDAGTTTAQIDATIALLCPQYLAARSGRGCPDPSPIFVVGLPRSGSTLIEQMLASHPLVEGTMELPEMANLARELSAALPYPQCLSGLAPDELAGLGARYLERSRSYRRTDRPFFIDKMPNNWLHAGLIHMILPNARIIDARRHPMATCFSAFKQHFARGQHYTYDLSELGRFYRDYVRLMAHLDRVLPGQVHRVQYERMVDDTDVELRHLLAYCGLDFDPACLRFHENRRAVRTASSEQVRRPIFRDGLDQWRRYEPWLEPLRLALADCWEMEGGFQKVGSTDPPDVMD